MDNTAWWYVDGLWVHSNEATLPINDLAVLRSYGVFEALRTYNRRPFHLDEHLERLYHSASLIELDIPYTRDFIAHIICKTIERNPYKHAMLRLFVTGGVSEDGMMPTGKAVLAVLITALDERDMERFAKGTKLITTRLQRPVPEAKTANYVAA